jgi:hypothetical protein
MKWIIMFFFLGSETEYEIFEGITTHIFIRILESDEDKFETSLEIYKANTLFILNTWRIFKPPVSSRIMSHESKS